MDEVRDYLESAKWAHARVARLKRKVQDLETQVCHITPSYSGMPGGGGSDATNAWLALAQLHRDYLAELVRAERIEKDVSDFIDSLATPENREVLQLRYCEGLHWPEVTARMQQAGYFYSDRQVYRIHGSALNEAREKWKENVNVRNYNESINPGYGEEPGVRGSGASVLSS